MTERNEIAVGIITISDRASAGDYDGLGGPALKQLAQKIGWHVLAEAIVPDDMARIQETIRSFGQQDCGLILTTGGTGIGPRDVTPEAIRAIMRVELPGFGEVMRAESMKLTPNSILSRSLAAIVDLSLVIALPGKPSGAVECLSFVQGAIPHGVAVAQGTPPTRCNFRRLYLAPSARASPLRPRSCGADLLPGREQYPRAHGKTTPR